MSATKVPSVPKSAVLPLALAILLNLIPIAGVLFWGWSTFTLLVLYWLENLVIGARTLISMAISTAIAGGINWIGFAFIGAFFTFHYGLFCFGHGIFVMALFGGEFRGDSILDLAGTVSELLTTQSNLLIGLGSIVFWQIVQLVLFVARGDARRTNVLELMGAPYPRIIMLHVTLIFGGMLLMALGNPIWGVVVLALLKTAYDVNEARNAGKPKPPQAEAAPA